MKVNVEMEKIIEVFYGENNSVVIFHNNNIVFIGFTDSKFIKTFIEGKIFVKNIYNKEFPDDRIPAFTVHFNSLEEKENFLKEFEGLDIYVEERTCNQVLKIKMKKIHEFVEAYEKVSKWIEE